jgi:hypothetical protein
MLVEVEVVLDINHLVLLRLQPLQVELAEEETEDFKQLQELLVVQI